MSYDYQLPRYYRVKENKVYPWPCEPMPDRTCEILTDDVLTLAEDGTFTKHTGLMTLRHQIPMEDVELVEKGVVLHVGSMFGA